MDCDEDGLNSDGTKAEEPKYGISLHKRHKYPETGSKGHKATGSKRQKFAVSAPAGECLICLSEDKHFIMLCPYLDRVPENAVVGSGCDVVCRQCGYTMKQPGKWICCKREGRAVLKQCEFCMTSGEHWSVECPSDEGVKLARTLLTHHNKHEPRVRPNPETFDPSRYDDISVFPPFTFVPFGGGSRMCPGKEYARLAILTFVHNVVKRFKWEVVFPKEKITGDMMPTPEKGLPVRLTRH
ncbi:hypothetical protein M0R45_013846 [Rubus argutus]|uniref:Cytochrome P450 n=1 Tax=Rubus argutus TaxID=59490 RepID=A0AAW1XJP9_RUBAR